jgi:hypothetical protein
MIWYVLSGAWRDEVFVRSVGNGPDNGPISKIASYLEHLATLHADIRTPDGGVYFHRRVSILRVEMYHVLSIC